jgi:hypothetical protein
VRSTALRALIVVLAVAAPLAGTLLAPAQAAAAPTVEQIESLLAEYGSPMQGLGPVFVAEGLEHGVDPAFLVAVAGAESTFGRFLYSRDGDYCTYNPFNWFYADPRQASDFGSWEEAIDRVATGIAGHLYYGSGLVSVAAIGPRYCPEGTEEWLANVTTFMLVLGADPGDTRYWRDGPPTTAPELLLFAGRVKIAPGPYEVGDEVSATFTIRNDSQLGVTLEGVRLIVCGPNDTRHDLGSRQSLTLWPGETRRFVASWPLRLLGRWSGWIEVDTGTQASLIGASEAFTLSSRLPEDHDTRRWMTREMRLAPRR